MIGIRVTANRVAAGADREQPDGLGAPLAVTGLSNLIKAWLFLDF